MQKFSAIFFKISLTILTFLFLTEPMDSISLQSDSSSESNKRRVSSANYVYQVLRMTGEGEELLELYDFENDPVNKKIIEEEKKRKYFCINKVARILVYYEVYTTGCHE